MAEHSEQSIRARQTARIVAVLVLVALLVLFAAANSQAVEVDWLVAETSVPLIVVIVVVGLVGALTGALAGWRGRRPPS